MPTVDQVLHTLETAPNKLQDNWCVPRNTGRMLHILACCIGANTVCEIGTSIGYSTLWLAKAVSQGQGSGAVHTMDCSQERQEEAKQFIQEAGYEGVVTFHHGEAIAILEDFQAQGLCFDMAFVDAAKKEYIHYIQLLEPMINPGGLVVADNSRSHRDQMEDFIAYVEALEGFDVAELETPNGQYLLRKR